MEKDKTAPVKKDVKKFVKKSLKRTGFVMYFAETALLAAMLAGAVFLWYNPQIIYEKIKDFYPRTETAKETAAVSEIKYVIPESVINSISQLNERVNSLSQKTDQFMNIKADSSVVLSMAEKMNRIEKKADALAKISNQSALILSAAMLVKESAASGQSFIYEAEILKNLSNSQPDIEKQIDYIYNNSSRHFVSDKTLEEKFNLIYGKMADQSKAEPAQDWKSRLIHKAKQYVHISEPSVQTSDPYNPQKVLKEIKALVNNGDLAMAINQLSEPENRRLIEEYPELNEWYQETQNKQKFYQAINQISSYSLSLMKAENLQNAR